MIILYGYMYHGCYKRMPNWTVAGRRRRRRAELDQVNITFLRRRRGGGHHYHPSSDLILITGYGFATDYNTYFKLLQFYNNPTERRKTIKTWIRLGLISLLIVRRNSLLLVGLSVPLILARHRRTKHDRRTYNSRIHSLKWERPYWRTRRGGWF